MCENIESKEGAERLSGKHGHDKDHGLWSKF